MQTKKMSLANIQGKLSRTEMKSIMAGSGGSCGITYVNAAGQRTVIYGYSRGEAEAEAGSMRNVPFYGPGGGVDFLGWGDGHWCCDSCGSIS